MLDARQEAYTKMIRKINPVAKAMHESRRRTAVVPDKKKHNKKKDRQYGQRTRNIPSDVQSQDGDN
jgi:hypothetical protein